MTLSTSLSPKKCSANLWLLWTHYQNMIIKIKVTWEPINQNWRFRGDIRYILGGTYPYIISPRHSN